MHYDPSLTLRDARALYFTANGFGDGGYDKNWVRLQAGPVPFFFPNTKQRVAAVRFHDLHHVVTGYETSWTGEAEIGAWEIASGCAHHVAAWVLNLLAMAIGLVIAPSAVLQAFARGRRTRNLYRSDFGEALLATDVGSMRRQLGLDRTAARAGAGDALAFAAWSAIAVAIFAVHLALVLAIPAAIIWTLVG